jgi:hypothetical protein
MTDAVDRLFRKVKGEEEQGGRVIDHSVIERTLLEIGKEYRPGLITWIKENRDLWARLLAIEARINQAAFAGNQGQLTRALEEYREFFTEMIPRYEGKGHTLNLFGGEM